eukprot:Plantae.Rhodophyta-Rhodochaete_pulchella.ctg10389.p1 GENE.Plantae.Rhodophyta-Rhodochaete_pulchella.ctg10389~~Plantae.Rhodophyta-Rhodochaete_pulchella.ctg10389.p1  ORF type:complete len:370 (+),score=43.26 Plantae.Rhodophyta-Rhodochaete_pulchella.ctg10389:282-1391(+)
MASCLFVGTAAHLRISRQDTALQSARPTTRSGFRCRGVKRAKTHGRCHGNKPSRSVVMASTTADMPMERGRWERWAGQLALLCATLFWSVNNVGIKILVNNGLTAGMGLAVRFLFVALFFAPFFKFNMLLKSFPLSLLAFGGNACLALALLTTTSGRTSFFSSLAVVFIPFVERIRHGKNARPIEPRQISSVLLSLLGIFFMSRRALFGGHASIRGDGFATLASVCFGTYTVMLSEPLYKKSDARALTAALRTWSCGFGLTWVVVETLVKSGSWKAALATTALGWTPLLALGGLAVLLGLAAVFQVYGQRLVTSLDSGIIYSVQPVWGALLGFLVLGETFSSENILGASLILTGVFSAQLGRIRSSEAK